MSIVTLVEYSLLKRLSWEPVFSEAYGGVMRSFSGVVRNKKGNDLQSF